MKKSSSHSWIAALAVVAVGAAGIWGYETFYAATTLSPGAITMPTPASGSVSLALPAGAQSWTLAGYTALSAGTATVLTVPTSPGTHLQANVQKGGIIAVTWVDSTGATQASSISFT